MQVEDIDLNLRKIIVTPPRKNGTLPFGLKVFLKNPNGQSKKDLANLKALLQKYPEKVLEHLIKTNFSKEKITEYSLSNWYNFPSENYQRYHHTSAYFASKNCQLYILGNMIEKMISIINNLKDKTEVDTYEYALNKIKLKKAWNIVVAIYKDLDSQHLWVTDNIEVMVEKVKDPLIYYDVTDKPNFEHIKKVLEKYVEIHGPFNMTKYDDNMMVLQRGELVGSIKLIEIDKNPELKDFGLSLVRK